MNQKQKEYDFGDEGKFVQRPLLIPQLSELVEEASQWPEGVRKLFTFEASSTRGSDAEVSGKLLEGFKQLLKENKLVEAFAIILLPMDAEGKVTPHSKKNREEVIQSIQDGCDFGTGLQIITDFFTFNGQSVQASLAQIEEITGKKKEMVE